MKRRYKMSKGRSRRSFTSAAAYSHRLNSRTVPMRGGIRL